jgi:hypothetical protein
MYTNGDVRKLKAQRDELLEAARFVRNTIQEGMDRGDMEDGPYSMPRLMLYKLDTAIDKVEGES